MEDIYQTPWPGGVTIISKNEFIRLQDTVGKVECVVVTNLVFKPSDDASEYLYPVDVETIVIGNKARLHLDGFAMGYLGEGPRGLIWLLDQLDISYSKRDIFTKPETGSVIFSVPKEK